MFSQIESVEHAKLSELLGQDTTEQIWQLCTKRLSRYNVLLHHLHMCVSRSILFDRATLVSMFVWSRMPVQYVIEEWDFRDLTLKMRPPVFIPRPETEVLSQKILQRTNLTASDEL